MPNLDSIFRALRAHWLDGKLSSGSLTGARVVVAAVAFTAVRVSKLCVLVVAIFLFQK